MNRINRRGRIHDLRTLFVGLSKRDGRRARRGRGQALGRVVGRIEELEARVLLANDFGDAPAPYPTRLVENGATHVATGLTIGDERDMESDGDHSPNALADDNDGTPDDEDGVTFGTIMVGALDAAATVTVRGSGGAGKLDAWIDFNGDGSWGGPGEQIADNLAVTNGDNAIEFDVPSDAISGQTFARFRLSTAGNLGPEGAASDGEVEDHEVTIDPPVPTGGAFGNPNPISTSADGAYSVFAADVDGDGDMDVITASKSSNKIEWREYSRNQDLWFSNTVSDNMSEPVSVFAADVNGDGYVDILSASQADDRIAWFKNDGSQNFTRHTISTDADGAASVFAADVDGDGDMDVLSASTFDSKIVWYKNDGSPGVPGFTTHTIVTNAFYARSVFAADVDRDGDMDVLSASEVDGRIIWYENNGDEVFDPQTIIAEAFGAKSVFAADLDGDGDTDVLSASLVDDNISWYENNGSQTFTRRTISTAVEDPYWVSAADLDGDGDLDVLSASFRDDRVAWYENDSTGPGLPDFTQHTISTNADGALAVISTDVDGDGVLDVLSASYNDDKIAWYQNLQTLDYGDAPRPYPTRISENGARHEPAGPRLGSNRDGETDGDHSPNADADDTSGAPDDEDGVTFGTLMVGALGATATVNVQRENGKLSAWIDFNGDGSWGGPGEQIVASRRVTLGDNNLTFDVPSWAISDTTFARFRLSTDGNLGPEGPAPDGEVEDYAVTIAPPAPNSNRFAAQSVISDTTQRPWSVIAADVDGDGDMDVLSASYGDDKIAWYENDGSASPGFTERTISTDADGAISVFAVDLDGDGDTDVLSASFYDDKIAWYENVGGGNFLPNTISADADGAYSVFAADVDGDGDMDVLSATRDDNRINWYENNGNKTLTPRSVAFSSRPVSVFAADVDGDGDMDILSASRAFNNVVWYENHGNEIFTYHEISAMADGAQSVFAADLDGDGELDALSASSFDDTIAWHHNNGNLSFTTHSISSVADGASSVSVADINGDGDLDVISASYNDDAIAWYNGLPAPFLLPTRIVVTRDPDADPSNERNGNANGAISVFAADMDRDGDLDLLSTSLLDGRIAWYENLGENRDTDFGDAPSPFPTTLLENGARHASTGPTLGSSRDSEATGAHSGAADADDDLGVPDDEDGVTFGAMLIGALGATVTVNVQGSGGKLDAWIDFNGDGSWGGSGEQIFASTSVVVGDNNLTFAVPSNAIAGTTYARFRLSTAGGLDTNGKANDGELEDYQVTLGNPSDDFGDAPLPYPTTQPENGPSHELAGPKLGAARDSDADGIHSAGANADDTTGAPDDEDGVTFGPMIVGALGVVVTVNVRGGGGKLDAWIDFNADGSWGGPGEQIFASLNISVGDNLLTFDVPSWAKPSTTFARFRLSTAGNLAPTGPASDGEVEDYEITLELPVSSNAVFSGRIVMTGSADFARSVFAADLDRDGDMDVLSASSRDDRIAWYENKGNQQFSSHAISTTAASANSVFATDLDRDGDLDVLSASYDDDKVAWYENDGAASPTFTERTISAAAFGAVSVFAADLDDDGDVDVLSASSADNKLAWYENDGGENFTARLIATTGSPQSIVAADVDRDGDLDVLAASLTENKVAWYENDGDQNFTERAISTTALNAVSAFAVDLDCDGDMDVLSASAFDNTVTWYDNNGSQLFTARTISTTAHGVRSVYAADLDGEGDLDVLSASPGDDKTAWYENDGASPPSFTERTISSVADGANSVYAADMDGDGDLDVLSASASDDTIGWYENAPRANDFGITDFTPNFRVAGRKRTISSLDVTIVGLIDTSVITLQNLRLSEVTPRGTRRTVPLRSVEVGGHARDHTPIIDIESFSIIASPTRDLALNKTYELIVGGLPGPNGPMDSRPTTFLVHTALALTDPDGDRLNLTLGGSPGFGYFKTLGFIPEIKGVPAGHFRTTVVGTGPGITLAATGRRGRRGDGTVALPDNQTLGVVPGTTFRNTLTNPAVRLRRLPQDAIDALLAASGPLCSWWDC